MKITLALSSLLVGAHSFGVAPVVQTRASTQLNAQLPEDMMSSDQLEIKQIQDKWNSIRHMDREQAQKELDGEWLEAFNNFYEKYDDDMTRMTEIAEKLQRMIEPPKVQKKSKGQKRRDAYAKVVARETARAGK